MNDPIRQLAQACDAWCEEHHIDSSGWGGAAWEEKFADLIIRACATLATAGPDGILKHFGVEP